MIEPNYIVIGAGKAGTSFLYEMFMQHPDVFWSTDKELNYFSLDHNYKKGWEWYCQHFEQAGEAAAIGEGSPSYTGIYKKTPERMARHIPKAKLIYTVRDPIERIVSGFMQFQHHCGYHKMNIPGDINIALRKIPRLVEGSRYWQWLKAYRRYYSDKHIHVIFAEDMRGTPDAVLDGCLTYLGVQPERLQANVGKRVNPWQNLKRDRYLLQVVRNIPCFWDISRIVPGALKKILSSVLRTHQKSRPQLTKETRSWLREELREDAHRLLEYCGKPRNFWNI